MTEENQIENPENSLNGEETPEKSRAGDSSKKAGGKAKSGRRRRKKQPVTRYARSVLSGLLRPDPKDGDRFRWVFILSVTAHLVIVLGVSFVLPSQAETKGLTPPLRITLVTEQSAEKPDEAKSLAQFDSKGDEEDAGAPLLPNSSSNPRQEQIERERKLVAEQANAAFNNDQPAVDKKDPDSSSVTRDSVRDSIDIAFLNAQAKPRERFVSANARASEIAPYLENWRLLVERVGNLNYPDAAKRAKIEGNLVMDVIVNSDGSVSGVKILRSSGHKILDDGAERIVHIAAPFNTFSEEMKKDYDTLHIIRTWQFSQNTIRDVTR